MNFIFTFKRRNTGFTLVELMIAMLLGLFLIGGVISVFLSNRQVYRQNDNLARMQESARYAFEVISRDIREARVTPCGSNLPTANVLNDPGSVVWWAKWGDGIHGYEADEDETETLPAKETATNPNEVTKRVAGTDAFIIQNADGNPDVRIINHVPTSARFEVNTNDHGIDTDDILMVCSFEQAAIFQVTNAQDGINSNIVHNTGASSPGNCSNGLGYPTLCSNPGNSRQFQDGDILTKLAANAWYIGFNGRDTGRSLYRIRSSSDGTQTDEIAEGISNMQIMYLAKSAGNLSASYVEADSITDWSLVVAVRIEFTMVSLETVGVGNSTLSRTWHTVVTLRNPKL
jgi:type IV pilus assembly protein PilW